MDTKSQGVYPSANASDVKIADFLSIVKRTHQSILSGDVLDQMGLRKNSTGFYTNQVKFSLKTDNHGRELTAAQREYFKDSKVRDFDSKYYEVSISAAKNADGVMVYNIGRMKEEAFPKIKGSSATNGNGPRGNASAPTVSHDSGNVKQRFSLKSHVEETKDLVALHNLTEGTSGTAA